MNFTSYDLAVRAAFCAGGSNQAPLVSADAVYFGDRDVHAINPVPKEVP